MICVLLTCSPPSLLSRLKTSDRRLFLLFSLFRLADEHIIVYFDSFHRSRRVVYLFYYNTSESRRWFFHGYPFCRRTTIVCIQVLTAHLLIRLTSASLCWIVIHFDESNKSYYYYFYHENDTTPQPSLAVVSSPHADLIPKYINTSENTVVKYRTWKENLINIAKRIRSYITSVPGYYIRFNNLILHLIPRVSRWILPNSLTCSYIRPLPWGRHQECTKNMRSN